MKKELKSIRYSLNKTVNSNELEVAHYFKRLFSQYGIRSHIDTVTDGRANLIATVVQVNQL